MKRWIKRLACVAVVLTMITAAFGFFVVDAASDCITVTSAISGEKLYSGNDLQEAFDAAERGSVVTIGRSYTMTSDAVLSVEVMISGQNYLKFSTYRIQLTGDGAIYVSERFKKSTYIRPLHKEYSEVAWVEESGGYIYYLKTMAPSMEGHAPVIKVRNGLLGAYVDAENSVIYLDTPMFGIWTETLSETVTMTGDYATDFEFRYKGHVSGYVATGTTMIIEATNPDYNGNVEKSYQVILLGDVNGNGMIDAADASLISFHANGTRVLMGVALMAADANRDGEVTAADAQLICEKYVKPGKYVSPLAQ